MNAAATAASASVAAFLGQDHRRLDAMPADVKQCLAREVERVAARFGAFRAGLDRHIAAEEGEERVRRIASF